MLRFTSKLPKGQSGDYINILNYFQGEDKNRLEDALIRSISDGAKWDMELMMETYTGKIIWVRTSGEPLCGADGKVVKIRGILMDIDKYKVTERALNKSPELTTKSNSQLKKLYKHSVAQHQKPRKQPTMAFFADQYGKPGQRKCGTVRDDQKCFDRPGCHAG